MALHETRREDLYAEATALTRRIELTVPRQTEPVVAGCRANGAWSIYFGPDPCYHFDAQGLLRRAFVDECLYRTQGGTLARLKRVRRADTVELLRSDLSADDCRAFLGRMRDRLETLQEALAGGMVIRLRCHPEAEHLETDLSAAVRQILADGPGIAPAIPTRKH